MKLSAALAACLLVALPAAAQENETWRSWNQPVEPFRIAGNLYYVGASDIASYLVATPEGHVVIDGGFPETAPIIRDAIETLGFEIEDVEILLASHAHFDHVGGLAALKEWSGAQLWVSEADAPVLESGGAGDYYLSAEDNAFPPVAVDRRLSDGDTVTLGGTTLTALLTPGHTRGCTSWSLRVEDDGRPLDVVSVCSLSILPGVDLTDNPVYPQIAADYARSLEKLEALEPDVFLASHGGFFGLTQKRAALAEGGENPFIDPERYRSYLARARRTYKERLEEQLATAHHHGDHSPAPPGRAMPAETLASYRRGLDLVQRALAELGGAEALLERGLAVEGRGTHDLAARLQGTHPERPEPVEVTEWLGIAPGGKRVAWETRGRVNPDAREWMRFVYDEEGRMLIVDRLNGRAFWVPADAEHRRRTLRTVPHLLLRDALAARPTLRSLGEHEEREAVGFTLSSGEAMTLFFDPASGRLAGFEYLLDLPLSGDTPVRWTFGEYRDFEGLGLYPSGARVELGGRPWKEVRYRTLPSPGALFEAPEGIEVPEPPPPAPPPPAPAADGGTAKPPPPEVRTVADGVHLVMNVRGGFHALVIELEDALVVVDAPAGYHELQMVPAIDWAGDVSSSSVSRRLLEAAAAAAPGKPVRYLVLTHHHGDHAGGLRPFLAAGVTIVASEATRAVVERALQASFTLAPDELTGRTVEPRIEIVDGRRALSDGRRTVEVLDVGPNPHAEGMLVVYLPAERILYQSDLFMPATSGFPDRARLPVMRWFVDWLDRSGLDPEAIYSIHGPPRVTDEQLAEIRALAAGIE